MPLSTRQVCSEVSWKVPVSKVSLWVLGIATKRFAALIILNIQLDDLKY